MYPPVFLIYFIIILTSLAEKSQIHYRITELEGQVYYIVLFLFSLKIFVV